jgi:hypothetical protein
MGYTIKDNTAQLSSQFKVRGNVFLRMMADDIVRQSEPMTPRDKGNLRRDVLRQVLGLNGKIEWRKAYASYQERGKRADGTRVIRNYTTPGTGAGFARKGVEKGIKNTQKVAKASQLI